MRQENLKDIALNNLAQRQRDSQVRKERESDFENLSQDETKVRIAGKVSQSEGCPYTLPEGVTLLSFTRKDPPVAVTVCSVVTDIPKFIGHALEELDARLHHPVQIKAGDSVFELLSKLADCGLELRLEWPPERIIGNPPESEPSKPTKLPATPELNAQGVDITDEDVPF